MAWKIFYGDSSRFSSDDGPAEDAPRSGVQVVAEKRDGRRLQHSLADFYVFKDGIWQGIYTEADGIVLEGELIDLGDFKRIRQEAIDWLSK